MNFGWYRASRNPRGSFREIYLPILEGTPQATLRGAETALLPGTPETPCSSLTILHVNDLHHYHLQIDLPGELSRARAESANHGEVIYLSAGDEYTGTTLDSLLGYTTEEFTAAAAYRIQTFLGLDAAALGNHDFDRGPAVLEKAIAEDASFPVLSANIHHSQELRSYSPAMIGVTASGLRIGIIACTTPEDLQVSPLQDATLEVTDPLSAVLTWYKNIESYVDVVVILSHLGFNAPGSRHTSRVDDNALAAALHEARSNSTGDICPPCCVIGGHTHTVIDPLTEMPAVGDIPIFQAGCNGRYLGVAQISLEGAPAVLLGAWSGKLVPLPQRQETTHPLLTAAEQRTQEVIGTLQGDSRVTAREVQNDRLCGECALINGLTDLLQEQLPTFVPISSHDYLVAACDASGVQDGFDDFDSTPGSTQNITIADLYRILPYADTVMIAVVSPPQLLRIIESNCQRILPREELVDYGGSIEPMDWAHVARGFLHFSSELRYKIEQQRPGQNQLSELTLAGLPVKELPAQTRIALVLSSFSARGNQGWGREPSASFTEFGKVSLPKMRFHDTGLPFRTAVIQSLRARSEVKVYVDGRVLLSAETRQEGAIEGRSALSTRESRVD